MKTKKLLSLLLASAMIVASSGIVSVSAADTAINYTENFTQYNATNSAFGEANKVTAAAEVTTNAHAGAVVFAENTTGRWELSGLNTGTNSSTDNKATAYVSGQSFVIDGISNGSATANFKLNGKNLTKVTEANATLTGGTVHGIRVLVSEDEKNYIQFTKSATEMKVSAVIDGVEVWYMLSQVSRNMNDIWNFSIENIDYAQKVFKWHVRADGVPNPSINDGWYGTTTNSSTLGTYDEGYDRENVFDTIVSRAYYPMAIRADGTAVTVTIPQFKYEASDAKTYAYDVDFEDVDLTGKTADQSGSGVLSSFTYLSGGTYYDYYSSGTTVDSLRTKGFKAYASGDSDQEICTLGNGKYILSAKDTAAGAFSAYIKSFNGIYLGHNGNGKAFLNLDLGLGNDEAYTSINEIDVKMLRKMASSTFNWVGLRFFESADGKNYYFFCLDSTGKAYFEKYVDGTAVSGSKTQADAVTIATTDKDLCHFNVSVSGNTVTGKIIRNNQVLFSASYEDASLSDMISNTAYPFRFYVSGTGGAVIDEVKIDYRTNKFFTTDTSGDDVAVTIDPDRYQPGFDFIAAYYTSDTLDNVVITKSSDITANVPVQLTKPISGQTLRLMAWDSMNTLNPITAAVDVN